MKTGTEVDPLHQARFVIASALGSLGIPVNAVLATLVGPITRLSDIQAIELTIIATAGQMLMDSATIQWRRQANGLPAEKARAAGRTPFEAATAGTVTSFLCGGLPLAMATIISRGNLSQVLHIFAISQTGVLIFSSVTDFMIAAGLANRITPPIAKLTSTIQANLEHNLDMGLDVSLQYQEFLAAAAIQPRPLPY